MPRGLGPGVTGGPGGYDTPSPARRVLRVHDAHRVKVKSAWEGSSPSGPCVPMTGEATRWYGRRRLEVQTLVPRHWLEGWPNAGGHGYLSWRRACTCRSTFCSLYPRRFLALPSWWPRFVPKRMISRPSSVGSEGRTEATMTATAAGTTTYQRGHRRCPSRERVSTGCSLARLSRLSAFQVRNL